MPQVSIVALIVVLCFHVALGGRFRCSRGFCGIPGLRTSHVIVPTDSYAVSFDGLANHVNRWANIVERELRNWETGDSRMPLDVKENDSEVKIVVDLPGVNKSDIKVKLDGESILTIEAKRDAASEEDSKGFRKVERSYGEFSRAISLRDIDTNKLKASFENGVLTVTVGKLSEVDKEKSVIKIDVK